MKMSLEMEAYLSEHDRWRQALLALRAILLASPLTETIKWRSPCYVFEGKNVVMLAGMKDACVLSFMKGALLSDPYNLLVKPGPNTRAGRVIRFSHVDSIMAQQPVLKAYVCEAIGLEQSGLKIEVSQSDNLPLPEELRSVMDQSATFREAFNKLTPGRQRGYVMHIAAAKQSRTRVTRIEKWTPRILKGLGLNDCDCGLSRRLPACDGSHSQIRQR